MNQGANERNLKMSDIWRLRSLTTSLAKHARQARQAGRQAGKLQLETKKERKFLSFVAQFEWCYFEAGRVTEAKKLFSYKYESMDGWLDGCKK